MVRRRSLAAAALLLALFAGAARSEPPGSILLLERAGGRQDVEERALADALRIYTRDLGCQVIAAAGAPAAPTRDELAQVIQRAQDARATLAVWLASDQGSPTLYALRTRTGELHGTPVGADDPEVVARTLALKIRALYARPAGERSAEWTPVAIAADSRTVLANPPGRATPSRATQGSAIPIPEDPTEPRSSPATAPNRPPITNEKTALDEDSPAPSIAPPPTPSAPTPRSIESPRAKNPPLLFAANPPSHVAFELALGFGLDTPTNPSWLRYGLLLRAALLLPRAPLAIELDGAVTTHPGTTVAPPPGSPVNQAPSTMGLYDVPLGLALTYRYSRGRFGLAAGPRASLHLIHADATAPDGRSGSDLRFSAGLGGLVEGRVSLTRYLVLALDFGAEALLPRQTFTVDQVPAADLGAVDLRAGLSLVLRLR